MMSTGDRDTAHTALIDLDKANSNPDLIGMEGSGRSGPTALFIGLVTIAIVFVLNNVRSFTAM